MEADPLVTPVHIKPEWYFLFAYAVLRRVRSKAGGVAALCGRVVVLPMMVVGRKYRIRWRRVRRFIFWRWVSVWVLLTWCGGCVVEEPYVLVSQVSSVLYFWLSLIVCGMV